MLVSSEGIAETIQTTVNRNRNHAMSRPTFSLEEQETLKKDALSYVLPHFADNAELAKGPKVFVRGEGCYLYDMEGNRYLDTFASLLTTICGHHRPEMKAAVLEQMECLDFFPTTSTRSRSRSSSCAEAGRDHARRALGKLLCQQRIGSE